MNLKAMQIDHPELEALMAYQPILWLNPHYKPLEKKLSDQGFSISDLIDAEARYKRFAPFFEAVFPETKANKGIIESPLIALEDYKTGYDLYLKCDHQLPISGSIKARGGIYEVIRHAEALLFKENMIAIDDDYKDLAQEKYKAFFSTYKIVVSSTGNLGLSIGIISAKLGFAVEVHMSRDAMAWKKDLLRSMGVDVVEYPEDYSHAVIYGRASADRDPRAYFVDDESSVNLFLGYGVAAIRLRRQLKNMHIEISENAPLFVYIPCGVGGGPGGIAWALKEVFGTCVHCVFVEPTHAPCMLLGMMTSLHDKVCVKDFNIDNITIADGLAVGRASAFVGEIMMDRLLGISTVEDRELLDFMKDIKAAYDIFLEPSALAGFKGFEDLSSKKAGSRISSAKVKGGHHVVWATGGKMVPEDVQAKYFK